MTLRVGRDCCEEIMDSNRWFSLAFTQKVDTLREVILACRDGFWKHHRELEARVKALEGRPVVVEIDRAVIRGGSVCLGGTADRETWEHLPGQVQKWAKITHAAEKVARFMDENQPSDGSAWVGHLQDLRKAVRS